MITHLQKWSLLALLAAGSLSAQEWKPSDWPVLKHYDKMILVNLGTLKIRQRLYHSGKLNARNRAAFLIEGRKRI
jgi:hypothetical protein